MALIYGADDRPIETNPEVPAIPESAKILHSTPVDGCCGRAMKRAADQGILDHVPEFACPRCGTEFKPVAHGPVRNWVAQCDVMIFGRL